MHTVGHTRACTHAHTTDAHTNALCEDHRTRTKTIEITGEELVTGVPQGSGTKINK